MSATTTDAHAPVDADVIVVGAGPVGLSAALALGREGIRTLVVERRERFSEHPRAHVVNARTMELMRSWGVDEQLRGAALPLEHTRTFGWVTRIAAEEIAQFEYVDEATAELCSPERLCSCPQDEVEPVLADAALALEGVELRRGLEAVDFAQDDDGVVLTVRGAGGATETLRARYAIAAEGVSSTLRELAGLRAERSLALSHRINMVFRADFEPATRGRCHILWFVLGAATQGIFIALNGVDRWVYSVEYDPAREDASAYTPERCEELIRLAVGLPELEIDLRSSFPWAVDMAVTERFREGRLLLAGDAAHRFPPMGGHGMNSGIGDVQNLAWKLVAVLRGEADEALLDSYSAERRPVAELNARQSMENARVQGEAAQMFAAPGMLDLLDSDSPEGGELRAQVRAAIEALRGEFHSSGQVFGPIYRSRAIVPDGGEAPASTITEYHMSGAPGARAPHVRLQPQDGGPRSTVDLFDRRWTLLAGADGQAWVDAAAAVAARRPTALAGYRVAADGDLRPALDGAFEAAYAIAPQGAVLVRPDGHVALRVGAAGEDPAAVLDDALATILGR